MSISMLTNILHIYTSAFTHLSTMHLHIYVFTCALFISTATHLHVFITLLICKFTFEHLHLFINTFEYVQYLYLNNCIYIYTKNLHLRVIIHTPKNTYLYFNILIITSTCTYISMLIYACQTFINNRKLLKNPNSTHN